MRRAQRRKYHFIYKTTCLITNRYYYGMHSTDNLNDGYLGSGKRLWYSINKHGKENHRIEIIEFFDTREELKQKEAEIVNETMLKDPMCMNLQPGGGGGFVNDEHKQKYIQIGGKAGREKLKWLAENDVDWLKNRRAKAAENILKLMKAGKIKTPSWKGKSHKEESKKQMSITHKNNKHQQKEKNSQYGTCWITNGTENKKIHKGDLIPQYWKLGRKIHLSK